MAGQRTSGRFDTTTYTVELRNFSEPLRIVPFGDIHLGSPDHAANQFKDFLSYTKELVAKDEAGQGRVVFLPMGDHTEFYSTSERAGLASAGLHSTSRADISKRVKELQAEFVAKCEHMRGRILGVIEGNHTYVFGEDENGVVDCTDSRIAKALGAPFLGVMGGIILKISIQGDNRGFEYHICAHHGKPGSGKSVGGGYNRVQDLERTMDADLYLMGDNHKRGIVPSDARLRLVHSPKLGKPDVKQKIRHYGQTGSFTTAYHPGAASFAVDKALAATSLGHIEVILTLVRKRADGRENYGINVVGVA